MRSARLLGLLGLTALGLAFASCSSDPVTPPPVADAGPPDAGETPCPFDAGAPEVIADPVIHTPRWAFEPWISKDISTGPDTYDFVKGFHDRDIPVGAVVLDSPWETNYNTFIPNPTRYPDFAKMVSDLHADNIKVVLWITQLINSVSYDLEMGGDGYTMPAPKYDEGQTCKYFVDDGAGYSWWKGQGSAIDFFNPDAVTWLHSQQNAVLDMGIDGWKLDFGDSYVRVDPVPTFAGPVAHQAYSEAYYRDYYAYGVHRRGPDFLTMVRAWDKSYDFEGRFFARKEHAPVAWMGDNRRDWVGIADALDEMFRSAAAGYVVVGSDIGGYLDRSDTDLTGPKLPLDEAVFARWTALGALNPFMQLHGRANSTPWTFPQKTDELVTIYRYWAKLHHELVPFLFSLAEEAYAKGPALMRPIGAEQDWTGDYRYTLGDAFLVAPVLDATGKRSIALPAGTRWYDWWFPAADAMMGGQTLAGYDSTDLARIPLFVAAGAIVPLNADDAALGLGSAASAKGLTVLVYPDTKASTFALHEEDGVVTTIGASSQGTTESVTLSRTLRTTWLRVRADAPPAGAKVDGQSVPIAASRAALDAAASGWFYEAETRSAWVKVPVGPGARKIDVQ
jgi:alpha-glucosidase (family GH31 glycosyl hydrolase)